MQGAPDHGSATAGRCRISLLPPGAPGRCEIYRLRHAVYACELNQHSQNDAGELRDSLDDFNVYLAARVDGDLTGFISLTPSEGGKYSVEKYIPRNELPFPCDAGLFEIRLLTVRKSLRGRIIAWILMYGAMRYAASRGATRIVAIGRLEVLKLYRKCGLRCLGRQMRCGSVTFELMTATIDELSGALASQRRLIDRAAHEVSWPPELESVAPPKCPHGGAAFGVIGADFSDLKRRGGLISADVLDAWFPPSPRVTAALSLSVEWMARTSPPANCEGVLAKIADTRGVGIDNVVAGGGSSDLIFLALRHWLDVNSRVLLLDPTYGEYQHVLGNVIGCQIRRLIVRREENYQITPAAWENATRQPLDMVVLVNPNSPTGAFTRRSRLESWLSQLRPETRVWIDETYIDYAGAAESMERFAANSDEVVVCKSMSKVYALSGLRAGYLCGPTRLIAPLRQISPPWAVSLPAQIAVVEALKDPDYYAARYRETHALRQKLAADLRVRTGADVVEGAANFVLAHLPPSGPDAAAVVSVCASAGVYLRDAGGMGAALGSHALRIAVKSAEQNIRIVDAIATALKHPYRTAQIFEPDRITSLP